MKQISDDELVEQYKNGDVEAFDRLLERYGKPLYNFVFRMLGNKAQSEDILQEVLGELFEIKQAENEDRIEQIEEKLSELKEKNSQRKVHREKIVNRRLEQLTASASGLAW